MSDERSDRVKSEQQEGLEARPLTREERASDEAGPQYTAPDDGDFNDDEPTAVEAGFTYPASPEERAMHIETEEGTPEA